MNAIPFFIAACIVCAPSEPTRAVRGLAAHVEIDYAPRLRARADQTPSSPILVRVTRSQNAGGSQRIEFIGAFTGDFDLRDHIEREDGQPITDLPRIPITIVSQLPADHGVDLYGSSGSWMNRRAHYRELMWGAVALWCAVPVTVLVVRALHRPRASVAPAPEPPPPTLAELLRDSLDVAHDRQLTVEESGRLELLLLRYLGGNTAGSLGDHVAVLHEIRGNEATRPLVLAIERWLHAKEGGEPARAHAAAALDELRRTRLSVTQPVEAAP